MVPAVVRRPRPSPHSYGLVKIKPRVGISPFLQNMGSVFDFPSMLAAAGFWFVWQNYLVIIIIALIGYLTFIDIEHDKIFLGKSGSDDCAV